MNPPINLSQPAARRFLTRTFALDNVQRLPDVMSAVQTLEFVQEDSINICGRIHDLILWARVKNYAPTDLHAVLYGQPRQAFEYYFPNLCVLPISDYPYFARAMQNRQTGAGRWNALSDEEQIVAEKLMAHLDTHGPLRTRKAGTSDGHTVSGWGTRQSVASRVMEKLWLHGHLMVARRENFERYFDRTARLHPTASHVVLPTEADQTVYLTRKRFRTRRLFRRPRPADVAALGAEAFVRVDVESDQKPWFALSEDADTLHEAAATNETNETNEKVVHLLAPLDPLVYDRQRLKSVWDFDYTWEVYTPQAKRKWGYYVLPILRGNDLIGRVDPKIDRKTGVLHLRSLSLETGANANEIAAPLAARFHDFARFLGATRIDLAAVEPPALRPLIAPLL